MLLGIIQNFGMTRKALNILGPEYLKDHLCELVIISEHTVWNVEVKFSGEAETIQVQTSEECNL